MFRREKAFQIEVAVDPKALKRKHAYHAPRLARMPERLEQSKLAGGVGSMISPET